MTHPRSVVFCFLLSIVWVLFVFVRTRQEDGGVSQLDAAQQGSLRRKNGAQCALLAQSLPYVLLMLKTAPFVLAGCLLYPVLPVLCCSPWCCEKGYLPPPKNPQQKTQPYFRDPEREGVMLTRIKTKLDYFYPFVRSPHPSVYYVLFQF